MGRSKRDPCPNVHHLENQSHSAAAEQSVLGGLMIDISHWPAVASILTAEDFINISHRLIYRAMEELVERGRTLDPVTLQELLEEQGTLARAGGLSYLATLAIDTPCAVILHKGITLTFLNDWKFHVSSDDKASL